MAPPPLRLPAFPRLATAYLVNELGNWLGEIALAVLVFDQTESTLATAGLFLGIHFTPAFFTPTLVARLDGVPARFSLPALYSAEAAAFAALALLANEFTLAAVVGIATLAGVIASAARALTRASATVVLAPAGQLREGNALLNVAFTAGAAAGPALGGLVVAGAGVETALLADAASFLGVAALLAARALPTPASEPGESGWSERLRRGFAYVRERRTLRRLLGAQAAAFVFFATVIPIEVALAKDTLGSGDFGYGLLLASWGTGLVLGSLLFTALRHVALPLLLVVSTLAIGVAYLGTAVAPSLAVACAASVVGGIGNGIQWVALVTAVQELTRATYQARVLALLEALASAMPGIGFLLGGTVAAALDPRAAFAVAGAGVVAVVLAASWTMRGAWLAGNGSRTPRRWMPSIAQSVKAKPAFESPADAVVGDMTAQELAEFLIAAQGKSRVPRWVVLATIVGVVSSLITIISFVFER